MDLKLKDKAALVTGGSGGLGRAICLALAAEGARVVVHYGRSAEKAAAVVERIRHDYGTEAVSLPADVGIQEEVAELFRRIEGHFGLPEVLVNNAACCPSGPITAYTEAQWSHTLRVNLTGAFLCSQQFVQRLLDGGRRGRIVNIASQAAFRGSTSGHLPYDASKGGLVSFTVALARELGPQGIAVNAVAPGMIRTEMVESVLRADEAKYLARIPLGRIGSPEEIADMVVFLASEAASYMTGATVDVSGGMLMR